MKKYNFSCNEQSFWFPIKSLGSKFEKEDLHRKLQQGDSIRKLGNLGSGGEVKMKAAKNCRKTATFENESTGENERTVVVIGKQSIDENDCI